MKRTISPFAVFLMLTTFNLYAADDPAADEAKVKDILKKLRDPNPFIRIQGPSDLTELQFDIRPHHKLIMPELLRALNDPEETVRRSAAWTMQRFGADAKQAISALITQIEDPEPTARPNAIGALAFIGPDAKAAIPALIKVLRTDRIASQRALACQAIGMIGANTKEAIAALAEACDDSEATVRKTSVGALWILKTSTDPVAPALLKRMKDELPAIRVDAISAAWSLKVEPKLLVPALKDAMLDSEPDVKDVAASALKSQGEIALPIFIEYLQHKDSEVRYHAAWAIGFYGPMARAAKDQLIQLTKNDPEARVRARAVAALGVIGESNDEIVPALTNALKDKDKQVQVRAQEALDLIESRKKTPEKKP